jgi:hypothetical protein
LRVVQLTAAAGVDEEPKSIVVEVRGWESLGYSHVCVRAVNDRHLYPWG